MLPHILCKNLTVIYFCLFHFDPFDIIAMLLPVITLTCYTSHSTLLLFYKVNYFKNINKISFLLFPEIFIPLSRPRFPFGIISFCLRTYIAHTAELVIINSFKFYTAERILILPLYLKYIFNRYQF